MDKCYLTKDLILEYAKKNGIKNNQSKKIIESFIEMVTDILVEGDSIRFKNFGKFEVQERPAREYRNPQDGKPVFKDAKRVVRFSSFKVLDNEIQV